MYKRFPLFTRCLRRITFSLLNVSASVITIILSLAHSFPLYLCLLLVFSVFFVHSFVRSLDHSFARFDLSEEFFACFCTQKNVKYTWYTLRLLRLNIAEFSSLSTATLSAAATATATADAAGAAAAAAAGGVAAVLSFHFLSVPPEMFRHKSLVVQTKIISSLLESSNFRLQHSSLNKFAPQ